MAEILYSAMVVDVASCLWQRRLKMRQRAWALFLVPGDWQLPRSPFGAFAEGGVVVFWTADRASCRCFGKQARDETIPTVSLQVPTSRLP